MTNEGRAENRLLLIQSTFLISFAYWLIKFCYFGEYISVIELLNNNIFYMIIFSLGLYQLAIIYYNITELFFTINKDKYRKEVKELNRKYRKREITKEEFNQKKKDFEIKELQLRLDKIKMRNKK